MKSLRSNVAIAEAIGENRLLAAHLLWVPEQHGDLTLSKTISTTTMVALISPTLRPRRA